MINLPTLYTIRDKKTKLNLYHTLNIKDILKGNRDTIKKGDTLNIYLGNTVNGYIVTAIIRVSSISQQFSQQKYPCVLACLVWVSLIED